MSARKKKLESFRAVYKDPYTSEVLEFLSWKKEKAGSRKCVIESASNINYVIKKARKEDPLSKHESWKVWYTSPDGRTVNKEFQKGVVALLLELQESGVKEISYLCKEQTFNPEWKLLRTFEFPITIKPALKKVAPDRLFRRQPPLPKGSPIFVEDFDKRVANADEIRSVLQSQERLEPALARSYNVYPALFPDGGVLIAWLPHFIISSTVLGRLGSEWGGFGVVNEVKVVYLSAVF